VINPKAKQRDNKKDLLLVWWDAPETYPKTIGILIIVQELKDAINPAQNTMNTAKRGDLVIIV
jgi:hypothetical protein